jgi:hypothetical protein
MHTTVLKVDAFIALAASRGHTTYEQQAAATGLAIGTLHRLRNGGPAGPAAIASICTTYGVDFESVFTFGTVAPKRVPVQPTHRSLKAAA